MLGGYFECQLVDVLYIFHFYMKIKCFSSLRHDCDCKSGFHEVQFMCGCRGLVDDSVLKGSGVRNS